MELEAVGGHVEACVDGWGKDTTECLANHGAEDGPGNVAGVAGREEDGEVGAAGEEVVAKEADGVEADDEVGKEWGNEEKVEVIHGG